MKLTIRPEVHKRPGQNDKVVLIVVDQDINNEKAQVEMEWPSWCQLRDKIERMHRGQ